MTHPLEFSLPLKSLLLVVSGEAWEVQQFNKRAREVMGDVLCVGVPFSTLFLNINKSALQRRLAKGRLAQFDDQLSEGCLIEFTCSLCPERPEMVLIEGHELSRVRDAELMLASYSALIEQQSRELKAAINTRDTFFSTMSHELRTPLNATLGFTESLIEGVYGALNAEQMIALNRVYTSSQQLMLMLTNLLHLSRLFTGEVEVTLRPVHLVRFCQDAFEELQELIEASSVHVSLDCDELSQHQALVQGDEHWLKQIFHNLLDNALKFTPSGKRAGVTLTPGPLGARLTVWDEGIGVSPEARERIFAPFAQADSRLSRLYEGSGVGLSLVQEATRLHQGQVSLTSRPEGGSAFHIDLPLSPHIP
jgi:signal transduction histidine kinase